METIKSFIKKYASPRIWYYIENLLVVGLLFYCIIALLNYNETPYQIWKNQTATKAIIAFSLIIFIIRKVKFFNWQSLFAVFSFLILSFFRLRLLVESPDIYNCVKYQLIAELISVLIIIDMLLYKNIYNPFSKVNILFLAYLALTMGCIIRRHDQLGPIMLIFPMSLLALLKLNQAKLEWLFRRFIDGWFIAFICVCIRSFIENPYKGGQYYGFFQMPGPFSVFIVCCMTVAISALIFSKKEYGILSFQYIMSLLWIIANAVMLWIIETRTSLVGILFGMIFLFIFNREDVSKKKILIRSFLVLTVLFIILVGLLLLPDICCRISPDWIEKNLNGPLAPIANNISKFQWMKIITEGFSWKKRIFTYLDIFTSLRLSIIREYSNYFNFDGNGPLGIEILDLDIYGYSFFAYTAHNTYIQFLAEFGYISFVELIIVLVISLAKNIRLFVRKRHYLSLLPTLWLSSMLGTWLGETNMFFYPVTFFGLMFVSLTLNTYNDEAI